MVYYQISRVNNFDRHGPTERFFQILHDMNGIHQFLHRRHGGIPAGRSAAGMPREKGGASYDVTLWRQLQRTFNRAGGPQLPRNPRACPPSSFVRPTIAPLRSQHITSEALRVQANQRRSARPRFALEQREMTISRFPLQVGNQRELPVSRRQPYRLQTLQRYGCVLADHWAPSNMGRVSSGSRSSSAGAAWRSPGSSSGPSSMVILL